jgi:hypothetical protein
MLRTCFTGCSPNASRSVTCTAPKMTASTRSYHDYGGGRTSRSECKCRMFSHGEESTPRVPGFSTLTLYFFLTSVAGVSSAVGPSAGRM